MSDPILALFAGASRGIGREISRLLSTRNVRVAPTARNSVAGAGAALELTNEAVFLELDVTDGESVRALANSIAQQSGRLNVLINAFSPGAPGGLGRRQAPDPAPAAGSFGEEAIQ